MKKQFLQNKKADIPVMILVLGVVAICILAISSFIISKSREDPLGTELFEEIHSDLEKFHFYSNISSKEIAADKINATISNNQLIIEKQIFRTEKLKNLFKSSEPLPIISIKYLKT